MSDIHIVQQQCYSAEWDLARRCLVTMGDQIPRITDNHSYPSDTTTAAHRSLERMNHHVSIISKHVLGYAASQHLLFEIVPGRTHKTFIQEGRGHKVLSDYSLIQAGLVPDPTVQPRL